MHIITINIDYLPIEFKPAGLEEIGVENIFKDTDYINNSTLVLNKYVELIKKNQSMIIYNALKNPSLNYCYFYSYIKSYLIGVNNWESKENGLWIDRVYYSIPSYVLNGKTDLNFEFELAFYKEYANVMGIIKYLEHERIECILIDNSLLFNSKK